MKYYKFKQQTTIVIVLFIILVFLFPIDINLGISIPFDEHIITSDLSSAYDVSVVDIDKDGHLDIVATGLGHHNGDVGEVRWYKNDGHNDFSTYYVITVDGGLKLDTGDFDGDTYPDVVVADYGQDAVYLYCSNGTPAVIPWNRTTVGLGMDTVLGVKATDIDNDSDLDVVAAAPGGTNQVKWYENTAGGTIFTTHSIEPTGTSPHSVEVGDLNKDGLIDVASGWGGSGDSVYWYKNNGIGVWSRYLVSAISEPLGLFFADINGDSNIDIVVAGCDDHPDGTVAWFENDGTPETDAWTQHTLATNFSAAIDCFASDMDKDGDMDILAASTSGALANCIALWENLNGIGTSWDKHNITTASITTASDIYVSDIDQDTDNDVFVCSYYSDTVLWFESNMSSNTSPEFISIDNGLNGTLVDSATPTFNWTKVDNTSQYWLQIATDKNFASLVLNITDINIYNYPTKYIEVLNITFTLPVDKSLPSCGFYYTRVSALT